LEDAPIGQASRRDRVVHVDEPSLAQVAKEDPDHSHREVKVCREIGDRGRPAADAQ
jgi:hypothetical protein